MIDSELRRVVMMLAKESLNNALKHARATLIGMTVMVDNSMLNIEVQDDCTGMKLTPAASQRHGLSNMRSRAEQNGGSVTFTDVKPHGTRVSIELPLPKERILDRPVPTS